MASSNTLFSMFPARLVCVGVSISLFGAFHHGHAITTVQNDFYVINVADDSTPSPPDSVGGFQLHTGALHPAGANKDITFQSSSGNVNIGTSFSGIRVGRDNANVYTSDAHGAGTANPVNNLDTFFSRDGPTPGYTGAGWRTVWDLFPEQLEIVQDVIAVGDTFDGSAVYHTVNIINGQQSPVHVEWLNLMDFGTENDGGPKNTVERPGGIVLIDNPREYSHGMKIDEFVRVSDFPGTGTYDAFWTLTHDPGILPVLEGEPLAVTPAGEFQFVAWVTAQDPANFNLPFNVFDYQVDPALDVATSLDSAGIASFGAMIPVDGSVRFTQVFWAQPIPEPGTPTLLMGLAVVAMFTASGRVLTATGP